MCVQSSNQNDNLDIRLNEHRTLEINDKLSQRMLVQWKQNLKCPRLLFKIRHCDQEQNYQAYKNMISVYVPRRVRACMPRCVVDCRIVEQILAITICASYCISNRVIFELSLCACVIVSCVAFWCGAPWQKWRVRACALWCHCQGPWCYNTGCYIQVQALMAAYDRECTLMSDEVTVRESPSRIFQKIRCFLFKHNNVDWLVYEFQLRGVCVCVWASARVTICSNVVHVFHVGEHYRRT